jgi:hypothetical protein
MKACQRHINLSCAIKYHVQSPLELRTYLVHSNYFRMPNVDPVPGSQTWLASPLCSIRQRSTIKIQNTCSLSIIKLSLSRNENKWLGVYRDSKHIYCLSSSAECSRSQCLLSSRRFLHFHILCFDPSNQPHLADCLLRMCSVAQQVKFATIYWSWRFITVFTTALLSPYPESTGPTRHLKPCLLLTVILMLPSIYA